MIRISDDAWQVMVDHAQRLYPNECCGAMLGVSRPETNAAGETLTVKEIARSVPLENAYQGEQADRYEIRPMDLLKTEREARAAGMELIGIYHSHPDCDAYFSKTDLENSCPWYSFVVLSIQQGLFHHANSFLPNAEQTHAEPEPLLTPEPKIA
ncbi:MAG: M67 family metallopeptidase [Bryobacterales bacterium]|nr:M67 family metallopeptidase [Bryobacterales bacterium]